MRRYKITYFESGDAGPTEIEAEGIVDHPPFMDFVRDSGEGVRERVIFVRLREAEVRRVEVQET